MAKDVDDVNFLDINPEPPATFPEGTQPGTRLSSLGERCEVTITIEPGKDKPSWRAIRIGRVLELRGGKVLVHLDTDLEPREVSLDDVTAV